MLLSAEGEREREKGTRGCRKGGGEASSFGRNVNGKVDVRARSNLFIKVSRLPSVSSVDEDEMWLNVAGGSCCWVRRSFFTEEIDYERAQDDD